MREPIIITGMFRSGTTLLWRVVSADPFVKEYFPEPLHPQLPREIQLHRHYRVYEKCPSAMRRWSSSFHKEKFCLTPGDAFPELRDYLKELVHCGALIKFVRMTCRIGWLLDNFRDAYVINIVRDPRAVCYSYLKKASPVGFLQKVKMKTFRMFYPTYFDIGSRNLSWNSYWASEYFQLLQDSPSWGKYIYNLRAEAPYVKILALWRVNVQQSIDDLNLRSFGEGRCVTIRYEDLCLNPNEVIGKVYEGLNSNAPEEVLKEARGETVHDLGGEKKWQRNISVKWLDEWKKVNHKIWEEGVKKADIAFLMRHLGY